MFCSNCGKELGDGVKFCSNCGAAVGAALVSSGNQTAAQNNGIPDADLEEVQRLNDEAEELIQKDKYKQALELLGKSLELNPKDTVAWFLEGIVAEQTKQYDDALKYYSKAIELAEDEDDAFVYSCRAQVYFKLEEYENALEDMNATIKHDHSSADYYSFRGVIYSILGDYDHALSDCKRALKIDPKHEGAREGLTYLQEVANGEQDSNDDERFTGEQVDEELDKYTRNVTEDDVSGVLEKEGKILDKAHGPLEKFAHNIKMLFSLIKDYSQGRYKDLPWTTIAAIVGCLLYIFSPIDLIPDFIPVLGLTDDAAVFAAMLSSGVGSDIKKYEQWKNSGGKQRLLS